MQVTKPFVYGVYDKKTDILFDISLRNITKSLDAIDAGLAAEGNARQRLAAAARNLTRVCIDNREAVAVFFREETALEAEQLEVINELKGRFDTVLAAFLEEGERAGEFSLVDARTAALAIGGMISWSYVWYRPHGRLSAETLMDQMAAYALRLAGAREPG